MVDYFPLDSPVKYTEIDAHPFDSRYVLPDFRIATNYSHFGLSTESSSNGEIKYHVVKLKIEDVSNLIKNDVNIRTFMTRKQLELNLATKVPIYIGGNRAIEPNYDNILAEGTTRILSIRGNISDIKHTTLQIVATLDGTPFDKRREMLSYEEQSAYTENTFILCYFTLKVNADNLVPDDRAVLFEMVHRAIFELDPNHGKPKPREVGFFKEEIITINK